MPVSSQSQSKDKPLGPFFVMWAGQAVSLFGSQLVQFALIWWLTSETGSALVLAVASLVGLLPQVLLGPVAGTLVDRWNRRLIMMVADSLVALATVVLGLLFWSGVIQVWQIYALLFVRAVAGSFHWPAMTASTSLMVPEQHLTRVQGLNQTLNGALSIVSAPLSAFLLVLLPMQSILAIDVITALFAIIPLFFIHIPQPEKRAPIRHSEDGDEIASSGPESSSFKQEFREGFAYVRAWPGLLIIIIMALLINLVFTPAAVLMPLLVSDHFGGGAVELGWFESAWGIGIVVGGLLLGIWGGFKRRILTALLGLVFMGIGVIAVGLAPSSAFTPAIVFILVAGVANPFVNGPIYAILQSSVAPEMQGRVLGLTNSAVMAMSPVGLILAGLMADAAGVRILFVAAGLVMAILALVGFMTPAVMQIEENGHSATTETEKEVGKAAVEPQSA
jgi:DHA3 family macrolide efflux protein-like MFS transporter